MYSVVIVGGGLSGLCCALDLTLRGIEVLVIERKDYPRHKFCGEYLSKEVLEYISSIGANPFGQFSKDIKVFRLYAPNGNYVEVELPLGGKTITRKNWETYLYNRLKEADVPVWTQTQVEAIEFIEDRFRVKLLDKRQIYADVLVNACGQKGRSLLNSPFPESHKKSVNKKYVGIKYYLEGNYPKGLVSLYNFKDGYCGALGVEEGIINVTCLCKASVLRTIKTIGNLEKHMSNNPAIEELFSRKSKMLKRPMSVSNIDFYRYKVVSNHQLMIGDAAGSIFPLAGNGMAMAIHSAKLAAEQISYFIGEKHSRSLMEQSYEKQWNSEFRNRLFWGQQLQRFMGKNNISQFSVDLLKRVPTIFPFMIRLTHGKVISPLSPN